MEKVLETPPQKVLDNLNCLKKDLDEKIPPKRLDRNLLIASWNIRGFGDLTREWMSKDNDSPRRDLHSVHCIAEIIRRFDVSKSQYSCIERYAQSIGRRMVDDSNRCK